ncbi:MAG TPA: DUF2071 domain-containing protein [Actinocrinis sp.]|nr:DUF2071 domain-containing protein [Actinocrinis sp.]
MADPTAAAANPSSVATPEPVMPDAPGLGGRTLLTQSWLDLAFLHWAVAPEVVAPLLPVGAAPDVIDGVTYVGLIAFRMHRIGWLGLPGLPYLGSFPETNVRLYSVDAHGRRGVVFRSLEASRLLPVLAARIGFRLPYVWAKMSVRRDRSRSGNSSDIADISGDVLDYTSRRRWPGPVGARSSIGIRIGAPVDDPTPVEHFVTARWGLHNAWFGRPIYLPNEHPRWPLYRAELLHYDEDLICAAGLPQPAGPPDSVLYSPGVPVRFGAPARRPERPGRAPRAVA